MTKIKKHLFNKHILSFTAIIALAVFLRLRNAFLNFWHDEEFIANAIYSISENGIPIMPSGKVYIRAFPLTYISALFDNAIGMLVPEFVYRLPVFIVSILSFVLVYHIVNELTNNNIALAITAIVAMSPWHIIYSTFLREYMLISMFYALLSYLLFLYVKHNEVKFLVIFFFVWLGFALTSTYAMIILVFLGVLLVVSLMRVEMRRRSIIAGSVILGLFLVDFFILSDVVNNVFGAFNTFVSPSSGNDVSYTSIIARIRGYITPSLYFPLTMFRFFPIGMLVIVYGLANTIRDKSLSIIFPLTLFGSLLFISIVNPTEDLQPRYLFPLSILYFICLGLSISYVVRKRVFVAVILLLISFDFYNLSNVIDLKPGTVMSTTMRISNSYPFFPETKSKIEYINDVVTAKDTVIAIHPRILTLQYTEFEIGYYLRTQEPISESYEINGKYYDHFHNVPIITSAKELEAIVQSVREDGTVYIISSNSENIQLNNHIDEQTLAYLRNEASEVVQTSDYAYAKVYIFR